MVTEVKNTEVLKVAYKTCKTSFSHCGILSLIADG